MIINRMGIISASADCITFLIEALPCIKDLCITFPVLIDQSIQLLLDLKGDTDQNKVPSMKMNQSCREARCNINLQKVVYNLFNELSFQLSTN